MENRNQKVSIVTVVACLVTMFCIGIIYLWSVFQQPVIDYFGWSSSAVTMASSAIIFFYVIGSLLGGFVQDKTSPGFTIILGSILMSLGLFLTSLLRVGSQPWLIYLTYGMCAGIGVGFAYSSALSCMQKWFPIRRGFASGLSVCAFGLSATVLGPLFELFITSFEVPGAFRMIAFTFPLLAIVAGLFVRNPSKEFLAGFEGPSNTLVHRQYRASETIRTFEFWALAISMFCISGAYMMIIPRVKTLGLLRGLTPAMTTLTVSLTGVASAISRLAASTLSDKLGRTWTIFGLAVINLAASLLMTVATGGVYIASALLIVCGYSGPAGVFSALSTDTFGTKHSGANYGMCLMTLGFCSLFFTWLSTVVNATGDVTGDYTVSFIVGAIASLVPLVLMPMFAAARRRHRDRDAEIAYRQAEQNG